MSVRQGVFRPGDDPYRIRRQCLDCIAVRDERTARLSIETCTQGTFAWYAAGKAFVRQRILRRGGSAHSGGSG